MKTFFKFGLYAIALAAKIASGQQVKSPDAKPLPVRSIFISPAAPQDGRDPFFPDSSRPFAVAVTSHPVEITTLTIKGFSGTPENRMVIINNHTFGIGDEGDVLTPSGRVHVRCLEINAASVVVEANNQRRTLTFSSKQPQTPAQNP